jgi:hypothetical protein
MQSASRRQRAAIAQGTHSGASRTKTADRRSCRRARLCTDRYRFFDFSLYLDADQADLEVWYAVPASAAHRVSRPIVLAGDKMGTLLAKNADVLVTMDGHRRELKNAGLFAHAGMIEKVGPTAEARACTCLQGNKRGRRHPWPACRSDL